MTLSHFPRGTPHGTQHPQKIFTFSSVLQQPPHVLCLWGLCGGMATAGSLHCDELLDIPYSLCGCIWDHPHRSKASSQRPEVTICRETPPLRGWCYQFTRFKACDVATESEQNSIFGGQQDGQYSQHPYQEVVGPPLLLLRHRPLWQECSAASSEVHKPWIQAGESSFFMWIKGIQVPDGKVCSSECPHRV